MLTVPKENSSSMSLPAMLRLRRLRAVTAMIAMTMASIHQRTDVGCPARGESRDGLTVVFVTSVFKRCST